MNLQKNLYYVTQLVLCMEKLETLLFVGIYAIVLPYRRTRKTMSHLKTIGIVFFKVQV
jgi:hypothetical protein